MLILGQLATSEATSLASSIRAARHLRDELYCQALFLVLLKIRDNFDVRVTIILSY